MDVVRRAGRRKHMVSVLDRAKNTVRRHQNLAMDLYWETRQRHPAVDHLVRAYERYSDGNGTQLASAVTYYAFLSFFPLLALAFAVVGFLAARNVELTDHLNKALEAVLPGLSQQLPVEQIAEARVGAGLLGVLGLLYAGLNVVSELRRALHSIWLRDPGEGPGLVLRKLGDLLVMLGLGVALLATVSFTGVVQTATSWLLALVGLEGSGLAFLTLRALALVVAIAVNMGVFLLAFVLLSGGGHPVSRMWRGALLGAVGFEVLKFAAARLLAGTLENPLYASFAVLVGLLVWLNLVMRLVMFSAAWTATWLALPPPYTGSLPLSEERGVDWTRPVAVLRPSERALAERRRAQRVLAGLLSLVGALGTAGLVARLLLGRRNT